MCALCCNFFIFCFFLFDKQNTCTRDAVALQNKYKKTLLELKTHAGWQRRNYLKTGGGLPEPRPSTIKIDVTGALLQLQQIHGHAMTGMEGFDCDTVDRTPAPRSGR